MIESLLFLSLPWHKPRKKIIIKFYKLAATENKQESTIRNESEALTESPLRTITLMRSQGLRRSQQKTLLGQFRGERRHSPPVISTSCPNTSVDVQRKRNPWPLLWIKVWITRAINASPRITNLTLRDPRSTAKVPEESCLILIMTEPKCHLPLSSIGIFFLAF